MNYRKGFFTGFKGGKVCGMLVSIAFLLSVSLVVTVYAGGPSLGPSPKPKIGVIKGITVKIYDHQGYQGFEVYVNGTGVCDDLDWKLTRLPTNPAEEKYGEAVVWDYKKKTGKTSYDFDHPIKAVGDTSQYTKWRVTAQPGPHAMKCKGKAVKYFEMNTKYKPKIKLNPGVFKKLKMQKKQGSQDNEPKALQGQELPGTVKMFNPQPEPPGKPQDPVNPG